MPQTRPPALARLAVSIHAPRCRGAMQCADVERLMSDLGFQSTLPVAGERCDYGSSNLRCSSVFQSTPPVAGERCGRGRSVEWRALDVSIHAPRCRGAMLMALFKQGRSKSVSIHAPRCRGAMRNLGGIVGRNWCFNPRPPLPGSDAKRATCRLRWYCSFNPRPPLPGSDARPLGNLSREAGVSIHAPRCRGAMHPDQHQAPRRNSCFNPRPPLPGSDAT